MRHGIAGNTLSRNSSLRRATVRDLAKATLIQQRICTTEARAKEARKLVDNLITLGKKGALADKRRAFAILCDHQAVSDLFNKTASRFKNRIGGYTRIIRLGKRRGDNAQLAFLELTEKEEVVVSKPKSTAVARKEKRGAGMVPRGTGAGAEETSGAGTDTLSLGQEAAEDSAAHPAGQKEEQANMPSKEPSVKKDAVKDLVQKPLSDQGKGRTGHKFMSGIRRMFNRRSSGK